MPPQPEDSNDFRAAQSCGTSVRATLTLADGKCCAGTVLELSQGGIVLELEGVSNAIAIGDKARVALTGECLSTPLLVNASVTSRSSRNDALVLQLVADDPRRLQASPTLRRRLSVRVAPRHDAPTLAELRPERDAAPVPARVLDLSRSGLRVEVELLDEGAIADCTRVHVRMLLASDPQPLEFVAEIRSRTLQGEHIQCGLQILLDQTEGREEVDRRLGRYVMARQVEGVLERKRSQAS
ncbi:MAG: PilZ domain-containing protein [Planctomycetota bacterium]|nr:PilZ domain-containing protein [Planctomycetota bacterium]